MYFLRGTSTYKITIQVGQKHAMNLPLLSSFILMFNNGRIEGQPKKEFYTFLISGLANCIEAIQYFERFPFHTSKKANSLKIFKELMNSIKNGDHRKEGQVLEQLI